jgi:hypothetical protein
MPSGSTAMNVYAEPRMTRDIDFVVEIGTADVERLAIGFSDDFYREIIVGMNGQFGLT